MDRFLRGLLGWCGIALVAYLGFLLALVIGMILHSVASAFCPEADVVSGMCTAPWFSWVELGITLAAATLAGALVVLFAAAAADRPQRLTAAWAAMAVGTLIATMMAVSGGWEDRGLIPAALMAVAGGGLALHRVYRQLDPLREKARHLEQKRARKEAQAKGRKLSRRQRRHAAQRSVPRLKAMSRRDRRRRLESTGPEGFALGPAAMVCFVLLSVWSVFMMMGIVTHYPTGKTAHELLDSEEMFAWWALACFLGLTHLVVEMACRANARSGADLRRLATNLLALVTMTLAMAVNVEYSFFYGTMASHRLHDPIPRHAIRGDFSDPSPGATMANSNQEWQDFREWLDWLSPGERVVGLEFPKEGTAQLLAQCTPDLWLMKCQEIRFRVGDGPEHRLKRSWLKSYRDVLFPKLDDSLSAFDHLPILRLDVYQDRFRFGEGRSRFPSMEPLNSEELDQILQELDPRDSFPVLVRAKASMQWLDTLLSQLEDRGAEIFHLIFLYD